MLRYDDVEQLVADMFHTLEADEDVVSVIADKDLVLEILQEMLTYEDTTVDYCNIDSFDYDKEYFISLSYDDDDECWYICVDSAYNENKEKYNGMGGYVLFHENVNSKALTDMQNNEMSFLTGHDWFVIGEDDSFESDDEDEDVADGETDVAENKDVSTKPATDNKAIYKINNKEVDKEIYDKVSSELDLLFYDTFKDIFNEFRPRSLRFFW